MQTDRQRDRQTNHFQGINTEFTLQVNLRISINRVGISSWTFELDFRFSSWTFELDFRVGFSSWTFELEFRVGISSWNFELDFRVGFSSWTFEFEFVYNEFQLDRNNGTRKCSQFGTREYSRVNVLNSIYIQENVGDSSHIVKYTAMNCWIISLTTICFSS